MCRSTLLVIFDSNYQFNKQKTKLLPQVFKHFYKVSLEDVPYQKDTIDKNIFNKILNNPSPEELLIALRPDLLVIIIVINKDINDCYIGVSQDVFSRQLSMELLTRFTWSEILECAKQTSNSPIIFS